VTALYNKIATQTMQSMHQMDILIVNEGSEALLRNPKAPARDFDLHTNYSIDGFRLAASSNNQDERYALK